ncbi:RNase H family protein [Arthrobacter sp. A2-55]|uniref:RNase H family protein n=1 Tax=Arthrobacter sp. A2-55 TaxID=2897337 RepID=UPI0021CD588C|nr:RNase H family protein [Arthrobacter sp. A2-55]MCU6480133.1 ribonuclease H [Arthrobacter sp. A2-55]
MLAPVPAPPIRRIVPALTEVAARSGVTVLVDRQPNLCRWAVHSTTPGGKERIISGPSRRQAANPSNRELAAQIAAAVQRVNATPDVVFASDFETARILRDKTDLPVSDVCAPPSAVAAARAAIEALEARLVDGLTLACDSSRGGRTSINGCGWVLAYKDGADPAIGAYTCESVRGGIRAGELAAIRRGLQSTLNLHPVLREGVGTLTILTDSLPALDLLERVAADSLHPGDDSDALLECRRILGSARGININFQWVRGHNGHLLNELADRLAKLARRNREMGIDEVTNARMVAGVREDARALCAAMKAA